MRKLVFIIIAVVIFIGLLFLVYFLEKPLTDVRPLGENAEVNESDFNVVF